ncbi:hypothetical protein HNY73_000072 [Argiope bruennichi]|uniref:Uncharacterized protein n=1 Tax=Argiope bruennichi TaxID=94029 RepID=A0A8T0FWT0_ARGBR|nr:hypothetical protein HNY73_000072 [Argiope bruennichi]
MVRKLIPFETTVYFNPPPVLRDLSTLAISTFPTCGNNGHSCSRRDPLWGRAASTFAYVLWEKSRDHVCSVAKSCS